MCSDDYEPYEARIETWRKARKHHECCAVGCDINVRPGDRYHILTYIERGGRGVRSYKHCARCWTICQALWAAGAEGINLELDCGELWTENWSATEPAHLAFMTADEAQVLAHD